MPTKDYDKIHRTNMDVYARKIQAVYDSAVKEAAVIGSTVPNFDPSKPFSFSDYPITHTRVKKLSNELQSNLEAVVLNGIDHEWTLSNNKNNELCNRIFGDNVGKLTNEQYRRYYSNNGKAADAFKTRKVAGLNLSDRIWKYTDRFKTEIEFGIDLDLRDGTSAAGMARNLKQYLQNPDKLFRRVRDEHGQLHLSKAAKAFNPGQGVYRSSVKNAERLARTETNMAYHTADHERWQQFDFVVGIEVRRSNNLSCHCPLCDSLAGQYPKGFKFTGWHPNCRCYAVPILKTIKELQAETEQIMQGEPTTTKSINEITKLPEGYSEWILDNKDRFNDNNTPYFIRDNEWFTYAAKLLHPTYIKSKEGVFNFNYDHDEFNFQGIGSRDCTIYVKEGVEYIVPRDLDVNRQHITIEQIAESFDSLPDYLRDTVDEIILADWTNPDDAYWEKEYGIKDFRSFATGGNRMVSFYANDLTVTYQNLRQIMCHELGHNYDGGIISSLPIWVNAVKQDILFGSNEFVSTYSKEANSLVEDFAESMTYYVMDNKSFKQYFPNRFKMIRQLIRYRSSLK